MVDGPSMDRLWAGWRMAYVATADEKNRPDVADGDDCVFCRLPALSDDESLIVQRGTDAYVVLNLYPYNSGHCMVLPYRHVADLDAATPAETVEMADLARRTVAVLRHVYGPDGFNLGVNMGRAAGAGVPRHLHQHVLPRWTGDTNFITTVGGVKVLPEEITATWRRVRDAFAAGIGAQAD